MKNAISTVFTIAAIGIAAMTLATCDLLTPIPGGEQTPIASDFEFGNLSQTAGSVTAVTIRPRPGKSTGTITVKYNGGAVIPQTAGFYAVTFDVAAATGWNAAYGLSAGTLTVSGGGGGGGDGGGGDGGGDDSGPVYTFNSIAEFSTWLAGQSGNNADEPYNVKLNVGNLGGEAATAGSVGSVLNANSGKYVYLDLSGSTITNMPDFAFCVNMGDDLPFGVILTLAGINLPDSLISIGERALSGCHGLTSIIIPDSVESIGKDAFTNCTGLRSVTIGSGITNFGYGAFWYCPNLTDLTIKNGVTVIGDNAFFNCYSITSVTIPDSVIKIGHDPFGNCRSLVSVTIGSGVTSIGVNIFSRCDNLTEIIIAPGNTAFSVENGIIYNKNKTMLVMYPWNKKGAFTIPNSVTAIRYSAFTECTNLTSITIHNGVTDIGDNAFRFCTGLTNVTIPGSVKNIGVRAFESCKKITSLTIENGVITIGEFAFSSCEGLTSVTIPDSVTTIGSEAFIGCFNLASVQLPNNTGFTSIERATFHSCGLTSITIPANVTSIGDSAFYNCTDLASVNIPNSVTNIEVNAFNGCINLTSVTIPASVTSIGNSAFIACIKLTSVTFVTGSNIASDKFGNYVFPEGEIGYGGSTLREAYLAATSKAGTYTREANGKTWAK